MGGREREKGEEKESEAKQALYKPSTKKGLKKQGGRERKKEKKEKRSCKTWTTQTQTQAQNTSTKHKQARLPSA